MRSFFVLVFAFFLLLTANLSGIDTEKQSKNVLILFSYVPSTPAYKYFINGIGEQLTHEYGYSCNIFMEYLESERFPRGKYPKEQFDLYNRKYSNVKLDLLICIGIDIIAAIKNNADDKLKSLPTITIDYDFSEYGLAFDMSLNDKTAVIGLKLDPGATLSEALEIFPNTAAIYFISGISRSDSLYLQISKAEALKLKDNIQVTFITSKSMNEILQLVHNLPANSLIFNTGFTIDNDHVPYYNPESVRLMRRAAKVPIFTYSNMGVGEGSFGGRVLNFDKTSKLAGNIAVRILKGADPKSVKITQDDYYDYLFDWRELERWNLTSLEKTKEGCTVLFKEITFFGKYKWLLFSGIVFLIIQSLLIISLIQMNKAQKKMAARMIDSERRYVDIIKEDRIMRMGMLTSSLSHELNQPLTAILSTAQAGKRFIEANNLDPALFKDIFNNIVEDDNRAALILKSIRGMMRLDKREKEKINISDVITSVVSLYHSKAIEMRSNISLHLVENPVYVTADSIQLQQVLLNLISNASHSIDRCDGKNKTISITEQVDKDYVIISVRDSGTGIDDTIKNILFQPFITTKKEGTGIGLAISLMIIEDHQGSISARNMPDGGAEFSFRLKIADGTKF